MTTLARLIEEDFLVINHGSIVLLTPLSNPASDWVRKYLPEDALWHGRAVVIEPRYFDDIEDGILRAGLTLR